eukprot:TRINITY_DN3032_c0_g3_i2.p1 TRINITY_DN3032_c0_g3~~TRINITY_DN3032_c0_g3_i2.p1  ORF type:complete len:282 (+),score=8.56 TRINITY_DN3032_c0_g3_i2:474-1319(+)
MIASPDQSHTRGGCKCRQHLLRFRILKRHAIHTVHQHVHKGQPTKTFSFFSSFWQCCRCPLLSFATPGCRSQRSACGGLCEIPVRVGESCNEAERGGDGSGEGRRRELRAKRGGRVFPEASGDRVKDLLKVESRSKAVDSHRSRIIQCLGCKALKQTDLGAQAMEQQVEALTSATLHKEPIKQRHMAGLQSRRRYVSAPMHSDEQASQTCRRRSLTDVRLGRHNRIISNKAPLRSTDMCRSFRFFWVHDYEPMTTKKCDIDVSYAVPVWGSWFKVAVLLGS